VGDYFMLGTRGVQDEHFAGIFGETLGPGGMVWAIEPPPAPGQGDRPTTSIVEP
jgi:hypothetical protein